MESEGKKSQPRFYHKSSECDYHPEEFTAMMHGSKFKIPGQSREKNTGFQKDQQKNLRVCTVLTG